MLGPLVGGVLHCSYGLNCAVAADKHIHIYAIWSAKVLSWLSFGKGDAACHGVCLDCPNALRMISACACYQRSDQGHSHHRALLQPRYCHVTLCRLLSALFGFIFGLASENQTAR